MNQTTPSFSSTSLATKVIEVFGSTHHLAYAQIAPDLTVTQISENLRGLIDDPHTQVIGQPLIHVFWEFVGAEKTLLLILQGKLPNFYLEGINREVADGSTRYLRFHVSPINEHAPGTGLLLVIEDTTETGRLEQHLVQDRNELRLAQAQLARANAELQRLNRLKSLFLSMAAHDMRAPLTAILGYASLLRADLPADSPAEHHEFLSIIASQIEWLDRLITDLLDLDQIEQGKLSIMPRPCDLNTLVHKISNLMEEPAKRQGLVINHRLHKKPIVIHADPERIQQILYNLLSNAIKYTPAGGRVEISTRVDGPFGLFKVKDTGYGMTKEQLGNLFEIYYRTDEARRSKVGGTGLGLFIVKTLVEAHQGKIDVISQPGTGTTFTVRLLRSEEGLTGTGE